MLNALINACMSGCKCACLICIHANDIILIPSHTDKFVEQKQEAVSCCVIKWIGELGPYLGKIIKFIGGYLKQLCSSLTDAPSKHLSSLICKSDFQVECAHNFSITITMTEAAFNIPTRHLVNNMTTKRMWKSCIHMTLINLVKSNSTNLLTCFGKNNRISRWKHKHSLFIQDKHPTNGLLYKQYRTSRSLKL